jgi:hypothetical protein
MRFLSVLVFFERSVYMTIERGGRFGSGGNFLKRGGLMAL